MYAVFTVPAVPLAVLLACLAGVSAAAEIRFAHVFGDHMVLQRGVAVPIWGTAAADERVTVEFAGQKQTATAGADGVWKVMLDTLEPSAEPRDLAVRGEKGAGAALLKDVLVGDVWLCGGQSNMVAAAGPDAKEEDTPLIRFTVVESNTPGLPTAPFRTDM